MHAKEDPHKIVYLLEEILYSSTPILHKAMLHKEISEYEGYSSASSRIHECRISRKNDTTQQSNEVREVKAIRRLEEHSVPQDIVRGCK